MHRGFVSWPSPKPGHRRGARGAVCTELSTDPDCFTGLLGEIWGLPTLPIELEHKRARSVRR